MKHIAVAIALVLCSVQAAVAQTADELVEKHLAALGGRAALAKIKSRSIAGTITLNSPAGELSGPVEVLNEAPNKMRLLITLDLSAFGAGKMTFDQRFDGTTGYVIDTLQGNRDITGTQLEAMRNAAFPSPLMNYKELGATIEVAPKEKVGDREAYVLVVKPKTGPVMRQYLDAETFLPIKQVMKVEVPPFGEIEQTTELEDWRVVDGIKSAFVVKSTSSVQSSTVKVDKVEHNVTIDPALFVKP